MHNFSGKNLYLSSSGMVPSGIQNFSRNYSGNKPVNKYKGKDTSSSEQYNNKDDNNMIVAKQNEYINDNNIKNDNDSSINNTLNNNIIKTTPSQYLLISSQYRDRLLYPNAGDFIIPFGSINNVNNNSFNVFNTTNPLTLTNPIFNSCWTNFISNKYIFKSKVISGSSSELILSDNIQNLLQIGIERKNVFFYLSQMLENCYNVLNNYLLQVKIDNETYIRNIVKYDPILNKITVVEPFPFFDITKGPFECEIINPNKFIKEQELLFIGGDLSNVNINNFDDLIFIYNVSSNEVRKVKEINFLSNTFKLEDKFINNDPTNQFMIIRDTQPSATGSLCLFQENKEFYIFLPENISWINKGSNFKQNDIIYFSTLEEENESLSYFHQYKVTKLSQMGELEEVVIHKLGKQKIKKNTLYNVFNNLQTKTNANVKFLLLSLVFCIEFKKPPTQFNIIGNYFYPLIQTQQYSLKGEAIVLEPNNTINPEISDIPIDLRTSQNALGCSSIKNIIPIEDDKYLLFVDNYNDLSKLDFLAKHFDSVPQFMNGINNFLILPFYQEGIVPLNFSGTTLTNSQMSCYEISIVNLILPNIKIISSGIGALVSSLPYVFVEISNQTLPSSGNYDQLYSNNPFSNKATFICSISDVNNPIVTKFIKVSSDGGSQTIKFSPFDNLKFKITLPNGQLFKTQQKDFFVPSVPNPQLQITALFKITKIE